MPVARVLVTVVACLLAAAVALVAPPFALEVMDLMARWVLMFAAAVFVTLAVDNFVDSVKPDVARAVGRAAFKVARAAYKVARR
jgi:hypothetical protein